MNAIDNTGHPGIIGVQDLRLSGVDELILGHQHAHGLLIKRIVLQLVLLLIDLTSLSETADAGLLGQLQNLIHSGVSQNVLLTILLLVKHVMLHVFSSFIFIVILIICICHFPDNCIDRVLLLVVQSCKNISNGLLFFGFLIFGLLIFGNLGLVFFQFRILFLGLLFDLYRGVNHDVLVITGIKLFSVTIELFVTMSHNKINIGARVSTSKNQA